MHRRQFLRIASAAAGAVSIPGIAGTPLMGMDDETAPPSAAERWRLALPADVRPPPWTKVPDSENAYAVWSKIDGDAIDIERGVFDGSAELPEDVEAFFLGGLLSEDGLLSPPAALEILERNLAHDAVALRRFDAGLARPRFQLPRPSRPTRSSPWALVVRQAVMARAARIRVHIARGETAAAVAEVRKLLAIGPFLLSEEVGLFGWLIATPVEKIALASLRWLAACPDVDEAALRSIDVPTARVDDVARVWRNEVGRHWAESVAAMEAATTPLGLAAALLTHMFPTEKMAEVGDTLRAIREAILDDDSDKKAAPRASKRIVVLQQLSFLLNGHPRPFDLADTARLAGEIAREAIARLPRPWRDEPCRVRPRLAERLAAWPATLRPLPLTRPRSVDSKTLGSARDALRRVDNPVGCLLVLSQTGLDWTTDGGISRMLDVESRYLLADARATRAIVALRLYERRHGRVPAALADLVAEDLLDSVPIDPFDGRPLRYSAQKRLLWAVGHDRVDDGGDFDSDEETCRWPVPALPRRT